MFTVGDRIGAAGSTRFLGDSPAPIPYAVFLGILDAGIEASVPAVGVPGGFGPDRPSVRPVRDTVAGGRSACSPAVPGAAAPEGIRDPRRIGSSWTNPPVVFRCRSRCAAVARGTGYHGVALVAGDRRIARTGGCRVCRGNVAVLPEFHECPGRARPGRPVSKTGMCPPVPAAPGPSMSGSIRGCRGRGRSGWRANGLGQGALPVARIVAASSGTGIPIRGPGGTGGASSAVRSHRRAVTSPRGRMARPRCGVVGPTGYRTGRRRPAHRRSHSRGFGR